MNNFCAFRTYYKLFFLLVFSVLISTGLHASTSSSHDANAIFQNALKHEQLGRSYWISNKAKAKLHYGHFRELMKKVVTLLPENSNARSIYIIATIKYADTCWHLGNASNAINVYEQANKMLMKITKHNDQWREAATGLIAAYHVMGDTYMQDGKYKSAKESYLSAKYLSINWIDNTPQNKLAHQFLFITQDKLSDTCILLFDYECADKNLLDALNISQGRIDISGHFFINGFIPTKKEIHQQTQEKQMEINKLREINRVRLD